MHENEVRPALLETVDRFLAPVDRAVVHDPEHPPGRGVGLGAHHLGNELIERVD
jgi:hypothetical protein